MNHFDHLLTGIFDGACPACVEEASRLGIAIPPHTAAPCPCVTCESDR